MTNFSALLKSEITRLARKEIRQQIEPLRKANAGQRRDIAELKRQIAALHRLVVARKRAATSVAQPEANAAPIRFVAKGLRSLRERLGLSAAEFGILAGVSAQSIYNWETGKAIPRKAQLSAIASLRPLGKREAQARLIEPGSKQAKKAKRSSER